MQKKTEHFVKVAGFYYSIQHFDYSLSPRITRIRICRLRRKYHGIPTYPYWVYTFVCQNRSQLHNYLVRRDRFNNAKWIKKQDMEAFISIAYL